MTERPFMNAGTPVEVRKIVASGGARDAHLFAWVSGYRFLRAEGATVLVVHDAGLFAGTPVRFPAADVRGEEVS